MPEELNLSKFSLRPLIKELGNLGKGERKKIVKDVVELGKNDINGILSLKGNTKCVISNLGLPEDDNIIEDIESYGNINDIIEGNDLLKLLDEFIKDNFSFLELKVQKTIYDDSGEAFSFSDFISGSRRKSCHLLDSELSIKTKSCFEFKLLPLNSFKGDIIGPNSPFARGKISLPSTKIQELEVIMIPKLDVSFNPVGINTEIMKFKNMWIKGSICKFLGYSLELIKAKYKDSLTGLNNKLYLKKINERKDHGYSVIFVDLREFKGLNDDLGQFTGDAILKDFGKELIKRLRPNDKVSRIGGDEYIVLCGVNEEEELKLIIDRLKKDYKYRPSKDIIKEIFANKYSPKLEKYDFAGGIKVGYTIGYSFNDMKPCKSIDVMQNEADGMMGTNKNEKGKVNRVVNAYNSLTDEGKEMFNEEILPNSDFLLSNIFSLLNNEQYMESLSEEEKGFLSKFLKLLILENNKKD